MAKRLFLVSAAILMLAIAYHLGARNAAAQSGAAIVGFSAYDNGYLFVLTSDGEVYMRRGTTTGWTMPLAHVGNVWDGTVNIQPETWSGMKEKYR